MLIDAGSAENHVEDGDFGDLSSYRGGLNFEAVGLSRAMVAEYFPGMQPYFWDRVDAVFRQSSKKFMLAAWQGQRMSCQLVVSTSPVARAKSTLGKRRRCICCKRLCDMRPIRMWKQYSKPCRPIRQSTCAICWHSSRLGKPVRLKRWRVITPFESVL